MKGVIPLDSEVISPFRVAGMLSKAAYAAQEGLGRIRLEVKTEISSNKIRCSAPYYAPSLFCSIVCDSDASERDCSAVGSEHSFVLV